MVSELNGVEPSRLYTIAETCAMLGIHRNTLRRYTKQNKIAAMVRVADGRILYRGRDIKRLAITTI